MEKPLDLSKVEIHSLRSLKRALCMICSWLHTNGKARIYSHCHSELHLQRRIRRNSSSMTFRYDAVYTVSNGLFIGCAYVLRQTEWWHNPCHIESTPIEACTGFWKVRAGFETAQIGLLNFLLERRVSLRTWFVCRRDDAGR